MRRRLTIYLSLWTFIFSLSASAIDEVEYFSVKGDKRSAIICSGMESPPGPAPLVFVFHGYSGNPNSVRRAFRIEDHWPEALVVYLQGLVIPQRDDGRVESGKEQTGWQRAPGMDDDRDLKFIDFLVDDLTDRYNIDRNRIYATGFSNGAMFTWVLLAARPHTFAAFAPVAGIDNGVLESATVSKPVIFHFGKNDTAFKFQWAQKSIRRMKDLNRVNDNGSRWLGNRVRSTDYTLFGFDVGGAPFVLEINEGGHTIPPYAPKNIAAFFKRQAIKPEAQPSDSN